MKLFGRQFQGKRFYGTLEEYLLIRCERDARTGCWNWRLALTGGYGYFCWKGKWLYSHRAAWMVWRGPIPKGKHVLHECDNGKCINPDHLFLGDQVANMIDMNAKGRHGSNSAALKRLYARRRLERTNATRRQLG
jgi:hypothetical protein